MPSIGSVDVLEDSLGVYAAEEVTSPELADAFARRAAPTNLGLTRSAFWIRMDLDPAWFEPQGERWIITIGAHFDDVRAYAASGAAGGELSRLTVVDFPQGTAPVSFELPEHPERSLRLLFRVKSYDTFIVSPRISDAMTHARRQSAEHIGKGIYYGVMIGAIVYNLFLAVWLRERTYALYVVFEGAMSATVAGMDRTLFAALPFLVPTLPYGVVERLMSVSGLTAVLFARDFLDLRGSRGVRRASMATLACGLVLLARPLWFGPAFLHTCVYVFVIFTTLLASAMAIYSWRRGNENAPLFMLAWGTLLFVTMLGSLRNLGAFMPSFDVVESIRIGSAVEAMLLAVALARRMNSMKRAEADARAALAETRLRLSETLRRQVASLHTLVGGVAHEIGNPLNFASGGARDVVERLDRAEEIALRLDPIAANGTGAALRTALGAAKRSAALAARGTERIDGIVRNLRSYVGTGAKPVEGTDLDECIRSTVALLEAHLHTRRVRVVLDLGLATRARCCPSEINQVIMNLVLNASQAMPSGGTIFIRSRDTAEQLRVVVSDTGAGVPAHLRQAIFDPFFTTRAPNEGTGLGLAVSLEIVRRHGGTLELLPPRELSGAEFAISLPRSA